MPWEHVLCFNKNSQEDTFKRLCFCYLFGVWHLLYSLDSHLQQFFLDLPDFFISRMYSWFSTLGLIKKNSDLEIHGSFITDSCLLEEEWTMSQSKGIQDDFNTTTWSAKYMEFDALLNWVIPAMLKVLFWGFGHWYWWSDFNCRNFVSFLYFFIFVELWLNPVLFLLWSYFFIWKFFIYYILIMFFPLIPLRLFILPLPSKFSLFLKTK